MNIKICIYIYISIKKGGSENERKKDCFILISIHSFIYLLYYWKILKVLGFFELILNIF